MPDTPSPHRLRLKFAVLGAIGAAMVLLPLGQVLRYQGAEIQALVAERATLDPLAQALAVQHGLLGHRDVSDRVLRGRLQLEAERRLRKAQVDESLWALQATLSAGFWVKALGESNALTQDWRELASRIAQRQLQATESHASHQLLLEQAVQVMDLVSAAAPAAAQVAWLQQTGRGQTAEAMTPLRLAALQNALQARARELGERSAALQERQALLALASATIAMLTLAAVFWAGSATPPGGTPPSNTDRARRSRGRRSADTQSPPEPQALSRQVLQRLREARAKAEAEAPGPPAPPA